MKIGKSSYSFNGVYFDSAAVVAGPKEVRGPLGKYFDFHFLTLSCNEKSWEKAELKMYKKSLEILFKKSGLKENDINMIISGDLNNQIVIGNYALRDYNINYLGIFSACASSVEGMIIASIFIDSQNASNIIVCSSSHNALAEKQFRYPNEYGGQRPNYITSTVTASTSILLTSKKSNIKVAKATIGKVYDYNFTDAQDLGRAMAPACYFTLKEHLDDFNIDVDYYDLILSGDLSTYGKDLFLEICYSNGIDLSKEKGIYDDAGVMIYDRYRQDVYSGGSGCGCLPCVMFSYVLNLMKLKIVRRVLLIATGALHNPTMINQKESIPAIAHAIALEVKE